MISSSGHIVVNCEGLNEIDAREAEELSVEEVVVSPLHSGALTINEPSYQLEDECTTVDCIMLSEINTHDEASPTIPLSPPSSRQTMIITRTERTTAEFVSESRKNEITTRYLRRHALALLCGLLCVSTAVIARYSICYLKRESKDENCESTLLGFIFSTALPICCFFHMYLCCSKRSEIKKLRAIARPNNYQ
ncbi:hypothetical protein [Candidatus Ichthyocystis hellenicum]|uniref:hypothetical protein n=1 Tax=Candidatus Ichthyocystis hellenicum TaxID=1561003 RepID=UPI000B841D31|nr:hypothetical protein [Candidatus Ichthyocystis hellenicum]